MYIAVFHEIQGQLDLMKINVPQCHLPEEYEKCASYNFMLVSVISWTGSSWERSSSVSTNLWEVPDSHCSFNGWWISCKLLESVV